MKILFYSTNSNIYDEHLRIEFLPSLKKQWQKTCGIFSHDSFLTATQRPGMFLIDENTAFDNPGEDEKISPEKTPSFYEIKSDDEKEIADFIASLKPDIVIASSFYVTPFDWLPIKDAIVAEHLRKCGVKTICHPLETCVTCFDKWRTHQSLKKSDLNIAKEVYVHHELFINAGNRREIKSNIYKKSVIQQIEKLHFPVVVKDTVGLSSYGMDVLGTVTEVRDWLKSKKFTSDRIVEEYISGVQAGLEIYAKKNPDGKREVTVLPPFAFSVNKYGITSPKQSVKAGPLTNEKYNLDELKKMMVVLSEELDLDGFAQVDLVFDGEKWFVIEINPRLSGMTSTYAASLGMTLSELMVNAVAKDKIPEEKIKNALNIKFPLMKKDEREKILSLPFVAFVNQTENTAAKQEREKGYCEVILTGENVAELKENIQKLGSSFPEKIEKTFFDNARNLLEIL